MPTNVIKTIGATSSPITPDYSTLASWFADCPANLVSDDKQYIGECLDQGVFVTNDPGLYISGVTTDSTHKIILRCADGASFNDKVGTRTTALDYNESNGVAIRDSGGAYYNRPIAPENNYLEFHGLQVVGRMIFAAGNVTSNLWDSCILVGSGGNSGDGVLRYDGSGSSGIFVKNCLIKQLNGASNGISWWQSEVIIGCTLIGAGGANGIFNNYGSIGTHIIDCAIFNFAGFSAQVASTNVSYNATDLASAVGSNNLTSLTFADQFENSTNDFRAASDGDLHAGTPDGTNIPVDITGTTRDVTTAWIGCWDIGVTLSYEQEGFRFRNDDGDEDGATWLAAQDTTITQPILTNTRIRVLVNATGDHASQAVKLQYRKVGDTTWRTIGTA